MQNLECASNEVKCDHPISPDEEDVFSTFYMGCIWMDKDNLFLGKKKEWKSFSQIFFISIYILSLKP